MPDLVTDAPRPVTPSTILARELSAVCDDLAAVPGVDPGVLARLCRARDIAGGLDPYLDACTSPESASLRELSRRTHDTDWDAPGSGAGRLEREMLSGHVEGQVLKFLVRMLGARRVLEIGMFTGYSALAMAEALPDDGTVVACELDADVARFARRCFDESPVGDRISVEVGPAIDTLRLLAARGHRFDLVFIDADKAGYQRYLDAVLDDGRLASGGIIAVDNTLMQGEPWGAGGAVTANGRAIAEFNAALTYDERVEQVVLPLRDGLTLIRRVDG